MFDTGSHKVKKEHKKKVSVLGCIIFSKQYHKLSSEESIILFCARSWTLFTLIKYNPPFLCEGAFSS